MGKIRDLVIATATAGNIRGETVASIEKFRKERSDKYNFDWFLLIGDTLAPRYYSVLAYSFLKKYKAPYLLIVDSDMVFQPGDVDKIVDALEQGYPVVGGLYACSDGKSFASNVGTNFAIDGSLVEARYLANGFKGIRRDLLEKMVKELEFPLLQEGGWSECYPFFECGARNSLFISEDWDFCEKVRAIGEKAYLHTGVLLGHAKNRIIWAIESVKATTYEVSAEKLPIWNDLAEYTGRELKDVINDGVTAFGKLQELWKEKGDKTDDDYYRNNEILPYDLAQFNTRWDYAARLHLLEEIRNSKVLDIGCGIGTAILDLAKRNNEVVGYDICKANIDFAKFRAFKNGYFSIPFTTEMPKNLRKFNVLVALDVLEHIRDLESFLKDIGAKVKSGTKFYHFDAFEDKINLAHFDHSEHINEWLENAGFEILTKELCIKR